MFKPPLHFLRRRRRGDEAGEPDTTEATPLSCCNCARNYHCEIKPVLQCLCLVEPVQLVHVIMPTVVGAELSLHQQKVPRTKQKKEVDKVKPPTINIGSIAPAMGQSTQSWCEQV